MGIVRTVVKNTFSLSLLKIINPLFSFILIVFIARYRDVAFFGKYSLILTTVSIFVMVSSLGLETLIVRDVSKEKSESGKYMINGFALVFLTGLCFALITCFLAYIFRYGEELRIPLFVGSSILILNNLSVVCYGLFKAFERNIYVTLAIISENIFRVGLSVAILYLGFGLLGLMTIHLVAGLLGFLIAFYFVNNKLLTAAQVKPEIDIEFCKRVVKKSITFALIGIVVSLYWRAGIIILSKIVGESAVGLYSAAFRLFFMLTGFIVAFGVSVFPIISRKYENQTSEFERISVNATRYIVIVFLFLAVVITFLSEDIVRLIYGSKFEESAAVLRVLVWCTVPFSMVTVFAYTLFSSYNQKIDLAINFIGLISNLIFNLLLVPKFSYIGTSLAIVGSTCILLICQYVFINQRLFKLRLIRILAPPVLSSAIMVSLVMILRSKINLYLLLAGTSFLYFLTLYHFWGFEEEEKAYIKNISSGFLKPRRFSTFLK